MWNWIKHVWVQLFHNCYRNSYSYMQYNRRLQAVYRRRCRICGHEEIEQVIH